MRERASREIGRPVSFLAQVSAGARPLFTRSAVFAVVRDELDVPYVVRFRLVRPHASL